MVAAARFVVHLDEVFDASSSVLRLGPEGVDVGGDYDEAVRVLRKQDETATRLAALRLADLEKWQQDVAVAQPTISCGTLALGHTQDENSRLAWGNRGPVFEADAFCQRLADSEAEVARMRTFSCGCCGQVNELCSPPSILLLSSIVCFDSDSYSLHCFWTESIIVFA